MGYPSILDRIDSISKTKVVGRGAPAGWRAARDDEETVWGMFPERAGLTRVAQPTKIAIAWVSRPKYKFFDGKRLGQFVASPREPGVPLAAGADPQQGDLL